MQSVPVKVPLGILSYFIFQLLNRWLAHNREIKDMTSLYSALLCHGHTKRLCSDPVVGLGARLKPGWRHVFNGYCDHCSWKKLNKWLQCRWSLRCCYQSVHAYRNCLWLSQKHVCNDAYDHYSYRPGFDWPGFHKANYNYDNDQFRVKTKRLAWRMTAQPYNRFVFVSWSWRVPCNGNQAIKRKMPRPWHKNKAIIGLSSHPLL